MMIDRDAIANQEATRDPIFLFQRRVINVIKEPDGYTTDGESWWKDEDDGEEDISDKIDNKWLLRHECAIEYWHTESVYLTREEAEEYGRQRYYNYPDGWRVFCVCAEGELAKVLKKTFSKPDAKKEAYEQNG